MPGKKGGYGKKEAKGEAKSEPGSGQGNPGPSSVKIRNPYPLLLLAALSIVLLYALTWLVGISKPETVVLDYGPRPCESGEARACAVGNCTGISVCVEGTWGGCKWQQSCQPGGKETCLSESCPYGFRECNECGTGFGPCKAG